MKLRMSSNQAAIKKRGRPGKSIDLTKVLELEKARKADQEIADELGVSVRTFRTFRKEHGISPAVGHGGVRQGAGRKSFSGGLCGDGYMMRQQVIDARANTIDAGLRMGGKFTLSNEQWLKWAGSAFKYNKEQGVYTSGAGLGIPTLISYKGVN